MKLTEAYGYCCSVLPTWADGKGAGTTRTNILHSIRVLGDVDVETIDADSFTLLQTVLKAEARKNGGINRITAALRTLLNTLKKREKLSREVPYFRQLPEPKGRKAFYSEQEVERMLSHCHAIADGSVVRDCILFAALTGCRKGELLSLTWSDVFLDQQELVFRDTKNKGEDRWLPITADLMVLLQRMNHERLSDGVLFEIDPFSLLRRLRKLQRMAGVDPKKNFHTIRHTTATMLFAKGAELPVVAEILGHSNYETTMRYSHATTAGLAKALATL
jgi:integrase